MRGNTIQLLWNQKYGNQETNIVIAAFGNISYPSVETEFNNQSIFRE